MVSSMVATLKIVSLPVKSPKRVVIEGEGLVVTVYFIARTPMATVKTVNEKGL